MDGRGVKIAAIMGNSVRGGPIGFCEALPRYIEQGDFRADLEQRPLSPIRNRSGYDLFAFIELQSVHLIEDVVKRVLPAIESLEAAAERDRYLDLFDGDRDAVGEAKA